MFPARVFCLVFAGLSAGGWVSARGGGGDPKPAEIRGSVNGNGSELRGDHEYAQRGADFSVRDRGGILAKELG
jgi:hypothetical protein